VSASADFIIAYAVTFIVAIVALIKWHTWRQFAIKQTNRADRAEQWMWDNSEWADDSELESLESSVPRWESIK
jgi:hypothetical protein